MFFSIPNFEEEKNVLNVFQTKNEDTNKKVDNLLDEYGIDFPIIKSIKAFLNKISIGEYFFVSPNLNLDTYKKAKIRFKLRELNGKNGNNSLNEKILEKYKMFIEKYVIHSYGESIIKIGESDKSSRICRFCENNRKPTSFKDEAHAISKGLGNKNIILNEECDVCNKIFGNTIEPDIINYLSFWRTFYDVKGRKKTGRGRSKKFYSKNKDLKLETQDDKFYVNIYNESTLSLDENALPSKIRVNFPQKIVLQNIYKSLCKYFLSVINKDKLPFFYETIKWINAEKKTEELPLLAEVISDKSFSKQPKLITYIRRNDNKNIPFAVGEFHFTCLVFVFIIPFSTEDDKSFISKEEFKNFWQVFEHYNKMEGWQFKDFSKSNSLEYILDINIKKNPEK